MIKTVEWVPNPDYKPENSAWQRQGTYVYKDADRNVREDDIVEFTCNGRGRGGHYKVTALVTKVNAKTFKATELPRSYSPGTRWSVSFASEGDIVINLSRRELTMANKAKAEEALQRMGIEYRTEPCNSNGFFGTRFIFARRKDAEYADRVMVAQIKAHYKEWCVEYY